MELQDEDVRAIMTPRTEMLCLHVESSLEDARRQLVEWGHSRLPVIGDSTDEILGILYAKDLLQALGPKLPEGQFVILRDLLREPLYIPITTEIPSLLELMKRRKVQLAIVHDEYGGVAGLVTMEDILEEIVGEIADEFDDDEIPDQDLQQIADGIFEVDAGLRREPIREGCGLELPDDDEYETIGGFVFSQLGRLPTPGESVEWEGWRFVVLEVDRRRISRLRIERIQTPADIESSSTGDSTES
jgi:CBS domain containing-hemolysin-like protein